MPSGTERTPKEQETLIFATPEQAREWHDAVGEQLRQTHSQKTKTDKEIVAETLAQEFASHGEAVATIKTPWEHTRAEHDEVQQLVDVAFKKDLPAALREARRSPHYPRNLDLLHDVLTGELYALVKHSKLERHHVSVWVVAGMVLVAVILAFGIFVLF